MFQGRLQKRRDLGCSLRVFQAGEGWVLRLGGGNGLGVYGTAGWIGGEWFVEGRR